MSFEPEGDSKIERAYAAPREALQRHLEACREQRDKALAEVEALKLEVQERNALEKALANVCRVVGLDVKAALLLADEPPELTEEEVAAGRALLTDVCQLCGFDLDGTNHSCPHERGKWRIESLDLSQQVRTGKVVTADAEHIVQWDDQEHSLTVLVETGYLRIHPMAGNAISITVEKERDD